MKVVALTGSIGMGKTTTAAMFADLGVPVWDADAAVHRLYAVGGAALGPVLEAFPQAGTQEAGINREALSQAVLNERAALSHLEAIVHPLVAADRQTFLQLASQDGHILAVVDVPLLYETGGDAFVDAVILVTCDQETQRQRVLARPGMTEEKFISILSRQLPDAEKRQRADFIIDTGFGLDHARKQVRDVFAALTQSSQSHPNA
jgi:dephospho-CoA kinase